MRLLKKIAIFAIGLAAITSLEASAQAKLPESHETRHNDLLARQRPIATDIRLVNTANYIEELRQSDNLQMEDEVYNEFWESQLVNPYGGIEIPLTKDLDVSRFVMPLDGGRISSRYGYRPRFRRMHRGIDIAVPVGDTVRCAFDGKVRIVRNEGRRKGYGMYVVVRHDNGMETVYGHLSKFLVEPNQRLRAGEPLALSGNTGRSTGPHLHFETRFLGLAINPDAIIDFENRTVHKDVFTFDKVSYEKSQNYKPAAKKKTTAKKSTAKKKSTTKKKSTAKKAATSKTSTKKATAQKAVTRK